MKTRLTQKFYFSDQPGMPSIEFFLVGVIATQSPVLVGQPIYCPANNFPGYETWSLTEVELSQRVVLVRKVVEKPGVLKDVAQLSDINDPRRSHLNGFASWFINCCLPGTVSWCHFDTRTHFTNFCGCHGDARDLNKFELESRFFQELLQKCNN